MQRQTQANIEALSTHTRLNRTSAGLCVSVQTQEESSTKWGGAVTVVGADIEGVGVGVEEELVASLRLGGKALGLGVFVQMQQQAKVKLGQEVRSLLA